MKKLVVNWRVSSIVRFTFKRTPSIRHRKSIQDANNSLTIRMKVNAVNN